MKLSELKIEDKVWRRRSSDKEPQWVETTINQTYLQLIKDHPEEYRASMDNMESSTVLSQRNDSEAAVIKCPECLDTVDQQELNMFGGLCEECSGAFDD